MITFQKIREIEREERDDSNLQELPKNIFKDIKEYLKKKEETKNKTDSEIREIDNIKNTIKSIIELRERKLINAALYAARTGMEPDNLTREEKETYQIIKKSLKKLRKDFFKKMENGESLKSRTKGEKEKNNKKTKQGKGKSEKEPKKEKAKIKYMVKKEIPTFVGPDLKEYNLKKGQEVELPKPLNDLLLKKGVIKKKQI